MTIITFYIFEYLFLQLRLLIVLVMAFFADVLKHEFWCYRFCIFCVVDTSLRQKSNNNERVCNFRLKYARTRSYCRSFHRNQWFSPPLGDSAWLVFQFWLIRIRLCVLHAHQPYVSDRSIPKLPKYVWQRCRIHPHNSHIRQLGNPKAPNSGIVATNFYSPRISG